MYPWSDFPKPVMSISIRMLPFEVLMLIGPPMPIAGIENLPVIDAVGCLARASSPPCALIIIATTSLAVGRGAVFASSWTGAEATAVAGPRPPARQVKVAVRMVTTAVLRI